MMLGRITKRGETLGTDAAARVRDQLVATAPMPPGVTAEAVEGGVRLTGKGLRRRLIHDPRLRNFGR